MTIVKFRFVGSMLRKLMKAANMASETDIARMFATGFADAQRVAPMVMFIRTVAKMGNMRPADFGHEGSSEQVLFADCYKELRILSEISNCMVTLVADKQPALEQHITNVGVIAVAIFTIYRKSWGKFLASQTYLNLQRLCHS